MKLFKTYNNQWKEHENKALEKLSSSMGKQKAKEMKEKRISVMNHDKKVREKVELAQVKEILTAPDRPATANCYARMQNWIT